jgi:hypothetical protein
MTGIEKFNLTEKIRVSFLKNAGNVLKVATDCNVPIEYARKICQKFKKQQQRDVSVFVASKMAEYVMVGTEQRKAHLLAALEAEINKPDEVVSLCCGFPVKVHTWEDEEHYICKKCDKDCEVVCRSTRDKNYILKLIGELREEDITVINFMEKLGFTDRPDGPQVVNKTTNYNLVLDGKDKAVLQDAEQMDPRSRETLRKSIESKIRENSKDERER